MEKEKRERGDWASGYRDSKRKERYREGGVRETGGEGKRERGTETEKEREMGSGQGPFKREHSKCA